MLLRMASCLPLSLSARFVLQRGSLGRRECRSEYKLWSLDLTGRDWSAEGRFALACEEELVKKEDMDE